MGPVTATDLVAHGRVVQQDDELYWAEVEVADRSTAQIFVRGTVVYRIVQ